MTIIEVSKKCGLSPDTLRYYEKLGLIPKVPRTGGGFRDYNENSCKWIMLVKCLRSAGVSVEAVARYITLLQEGDATFNERMNLLKKQREKLLEQLQELQRSLEYLDYKIDFYEKGGYSSALAQDWCGKSLSKKNRDSKKGKENEK